MTTLLEIKPIIHDFIQEKLDEKFGDKIYWIGERVNEPDYPYCMLTELVDNKDKRTSRHYGSLTDDDIREKITTRYKTAVITVGIYNYFLQCLLLSADISADHRSLPCWSNPYLG